MEIQVKKSEGRWKLRLWAQLDETHPAEAWCVAEATFWPNKASWSEAFGRARRAAKKKLGK